jgi:RNA polymerase sigma factor (sigma-70 family)
LVSQVENQFLTQEKNNPMNPTTNLNDQELLEQFILGDSRAFEVIVKRHKEKIFTSILMLVKDKYLAEDIFQELFIRIIDTVKAGKYNDEGKFLPWAMRIAHNMCVDHFRKIKRSPRVTSSGEYDIFETIGYSDDNAEKKIVKTETAQHVRKMIDQLADDQREVIILRHYANLSFKEIAHLTGSSINTSLGRMRYGLINLRKMMTENQIAA